MTALKRAQTPARATDEGAEVDDLPASGSELQAEDRARLNDALARSWAQAQAGQTRPVEDLLARLRAKG